MEIYAPNYGDDGDDDDGDGDGDGAGDGDGDNDNNNKGKHPIVCQTRENANTYLYGIQFCSCVFKLIRKVIVSCFTKSGLISKLTKLKKCQRKMMNSTILLFPAV